MMRGADATHMAEIQWMIDQDQITRADMLECLGAARLPNDSNEWPQLFAAASAAVLEMRYGGE
jgi:hypothetical protein